MERLSEYEGWDNASSGEQNVAIESRIGDLKECIIEVETLIADGDTSSILGNPQECLESMKRELAELEWLALSRES